MYVDPILPPERLEAMRRRGFWRDRILTHFLDDVVAKAPDRPAIRRR